MKSRATRVIWAYDREHLLHPLIVLGVNTLIDAGYEVTVVAADRSRSGRYVSHPSFSPDRRVRNFQRVVFDERTRLERKQIENHHACRRLERSLQKTGDKALRGRRRLEARWDIARLRLENRLISPWRNVLKAWGTWRRLNLDTWTIYLRGLARLRRLDGEVMIASRPEAAALAGLVAKLKGMRFVYFPFELYGEQVTRPNPMVAAAERFLLRHWADAVITQNDCRAKVLREERGSRVEPLIVHNYKPTKAETRPRGRLHVLHGIPDRSRIVLYEGMIVEGRWLEHVARSVLHLPDDVVLVMMGQEKMKWRQAHAAELGPALASGRLFIAPPVPHEELPDHVADADVGVIVYDDSVRNNVFCEPGKLTDYISVGVPVVAPNFPTIGPVVRGMDLGVCFEGHGPEAIAAAILQVLARPRRQWAPSLKRACSELTWETQAPNLLAAVTGEIGHAGARPQPRRRPPAHHAPTLPAETA